MESLYSDDFWKYAKDQDWLEEIEEEITIKVKDLHHVSDIFLPEYKRLQSKYKFSKKGKMAAYKYIDKRNDEKAETILKHFYDELKEIIDYIKQPKEHFVFINNNRQKSPHGNTDHPHQRR